MEIRYEKLVRDKIPQMIEQEGFVPNVRVLDEAEYAEALRTKLTEEVQEYLADRNSEELADILEVVYALAALQKTTPQELEAIRKEKAEQRGGFSARLHLISKSK